MSLRGQRTLAVLLSAFAASTSPMAIADASPFQQADNDDGGSSRDDDDDDDSDFGFILGAELGIFSGSIESGGDDPDITVFTPRFYVGWTQDLFGVSAIVPLVSTDISGDEEVDSSNFRIANPLLRGFLTFDLPLVDLEVGLGATIPLASIPDEPDNTAEVAGLGYGAAMNGFADIWLYAPETFSLVADANLSFDLFFLEVRGDAAIAVMIPTTSDRDTIFPVRLGVDALVGVFPFVSVGVRVQTVFLILEDDNLVDGGGDQFQSSFAPIIELELGPVQAQAKLFVNIDGPGGFSFDSNRVWGAYLSAGLRF